MLDAIMKLDPCHEAWEWLDANADETPETLYNTCRRGDWLLWLAARAGVERKAVALAACDCADTVKHLVPESARNTTDVVRDYLDGKATIDDVKEARRKAAAAANAAVAATAAAYTAAAAAYTATNAAYRATNPVHAAYAAADAHYAASYAAYIDAAAAREKSLKESADIVRRRISFETVTKALNEKGE
jgi:hypothetical protein